MGGTIASIFAGGGGGGQQAVPQQAQQIDYGQLMAAASAAARAQVTQQFEDSIKYYPQQEALQLGTVDKVRNNLNNSYTKRAEGIIDTTLQQGATALAGTGNRINALGDITGDLAASAYRQADGSTALDRQIASQGAGAMNVRADQVGMPYRVRSVNGNAVNAAQIGAIDNVSARQVAASQMGMTPSVQSRDFGGARMADRKAHV